MKNKNNSRRDFIKKASVSIASFYIVPRSVLGKGYIPPSDKLNLAAVGCGGKGIVDLNGIWDNGKNNIAALYDIDFENAKEAVTKWPNANKYKDFREMLDKEKGIDGISVTTPDHTHYVVAMAAMQAGKHVYVQKPLAHNIAEVRKLTEAAKKYKLVTQMGNQGASGEGVRRMQEWYNANRVHVWTNRPVWPQGIAKPAGKFEVPKHIDWNLWLGPAAWEDYNPAYHPFNWRGWTAYGTGALGDMGCHQMDPPYRILKLGYPSEVEASMAATWTDFFVKGYFPDSFPSASTIHLKFPRPGKSPVKLTWYDGGIEPERPDQIPANVPLGDDSGGAILVGSKGVMMCGLYGSKPTLWPESKFANVSSKVPKSLPRVIGADEEGHYQQWLQAIKDGYGKHKPLSSSFDYAGPFTEAVIMGNLAIKSAMYREPATDGGFNYPGRKKLLWDGPNMRITNFEAGNQFVTRNYREGWKM
jgi:Oxidoreductase family, NAD-binding Rossmann fold/Oxidoreductase family, C-terminal alpha/beta domain